MAKLKVFRANLGFFETIVAAPSKTAALQAWGTHQDLFRDGSAAVTTDPLAVEAASAEPGVVLRRGVGSSAPFKPASEPPTDLPPPPAAKPRAKSAAKATPPRPRPAPDRVRLTTAERQLSDAEEGVAKALADIAARRARLDAEETDLRAEAQREHRTLHAALEQAKAAYLKQGGTD